MKSGRFISGFIISSLIISYGCKKESPQPVLKSAFTVNNSIVITGDTVTFTNQSENAFAYQWIFGDGGTSTLENPSHVYKDHGGYRVLLRALGSYGADTSYAYVTVKPKDAKIITEGKKIEEISLGDKWAKVQNVFPLIDTGYYSDYLTNYSVYSNLIYYKDRGIVAGFLSNHSFISLEDSVFEIILVADYPGVTTKGITLGSKLTEVVHTYGNPEHTLFDFSDTGLSYSSKGIDFYSYNNIDTALVAEIDVYFPNNTINRIVANRTGSINFHKP